MKAVVRSLLNQEDQPKPSILSRNGMVEEIKAKGEKIINIQSSINLPRKDMPAIKREYAANRNIAQETKIIA